MAKVGHNTTLQTPSNPIIGYLRNESWSRDAKYGMEYAAAIGWLYFLFIILLIVLLVWVTNIYISRAEKSEVKRRDIY